MTEPDNPSVLVREAIYRKLTENREYTLNGLAQELIQELGADLLHQWFDEVMEALLAQHLRNVHRSVRSQYTRQRDYEHRAAALEQFEETGDEAHLSIFRGLRYALKDEEGNNYWKPLGLLTGLDHAELAADYTARAQQSDMHAALHRAVARIVGKRTTEEVLTEEQYLEIVDRYVPQETRRGRLLVK